MLLQLLNVPWLQMLLAAATVQGFSLQMLAAAANVQGFCCNCFNLLASMLQLLGFCCAAKLLLRCFVLQLFTKMPKLQPSMCKLHTENVRLHDAG